MSDQGIVVYDPRVFMALCRKRDSAETSYRYYVRKYGSDSDAARQADLRREQAWVDVNAYRELKTNETD
jgi:hypothetical protein